MPKTPRVAVMLDLQWPLKWHTDIFAGVQKFANEQGWESIIDEFAGERLANGASADALPYDGVIGRVSAALARNAKRRGIPLVNVWFNSPVRDRVPGVFPDVEAAGRIQAEHLISRGFRQFGVLRTTDRSHKEKANAFRDTVARAGFRCLTQEVPLNPQVNFATWSRAEQTIDAWMERWHLPIGVAVDAEELARLVIQLCRRRGWRVPGDVAVITSSNEELLCNHPRPSLSSVERGYDRIGYEAARLLNQLMGGRKRPRPGKAAEAEPRHIFLPPVGLVVRESTDFYAVDDDLVARALQFIAANSHRDINCDDVARAVAVHTRTLQRRFRSVVDWPIADEIRRVRIERAKRALAASSQSLAQIAREVGFGDRMRMYEVFQRDVGMTPRAYRKSRMSDAASRAST